MFERIRREHEETLQTADEGYGTERDKFLFMILLLIVDVIITVGEEIVKATKEGPHP